MLRAFLKMCMVTSSIGGNSPDAKTFRPATRGPCRFYARHQHIPPRSFRNHWLVGHLFVIQGRRPQVYAPRYLNAGMARISSPEMRAFFMGQTMSEAGKLIEECRKRGLEITLKDDAMYLYGPPAEIDLMMPRLREHLDEVLTMVYGLHHALPPSSLKELH